MAERRQVDLQRVMTRISILVARNCFAPISEMWREAPRLWPSEAGVNLDRITHRSIIKTTFLLYWAAGGAIAVG